MIPRPEDVDELKKHVHRINYLLVKVPVQKTTTISFTVDDGGIPSEDHRLELAELYGRQEWTVETGQGEVSNQFQIRLSRPKV